MLRRALHFTLRKLWLALALFLVLAAVMLSIVRYSLPYLNNYRDNIEQLVAEQFNQDIRIGALSADWSAFGPSLVLEDVELALGTAYPYELKVARTHLVLNLWQSIRQRDWILEDFVMDGVHADIEVDWQLGNNQDGQLLEAIEQLLLVQLESFMVVNSEVLLRDGRGHSRSLHVEQLSWNNRGHQRHGTGRFRVSEVPTNTFNFIVNAAGDHFLDMQGELYIEADALDLSSWVETVIDDVEITEAQVSVNAWFDFAAGQLGNAQVHFGENSLRWVRDDQAHALVTSPVTWGFWAEDAGLFMSSKPLIITVDEVQWPVESVRWAFQQGQHSLHLQDLSFSETTPLWSLFGSPGAQIRDWFAGIQPEGLINDVQVRLDENNDWSFYVRADTLNWQAHRGVPGLSGLSFELWSTEQQGAFALRGDEVNVLSPITYSDEQRLSQIDWSGYWHRLDAGFRIALPQGRVRLADVELEQQFVLTREQPQSTAIEWWLQGHSATLPVTDALALLPLQLGTNLTDYLRTAVVKGEVNRVNMLWRGTLEQFPYQQQDGILMARLLADDLDFKFQPDWPAVKNTALALEFSDSSLLFQAQGGDMLGTELIEVNAQIPDLFQSRPWLLLDAQARGSATAAREVFQQSPLADSIGATLEQLHSDGTFDGEFSLRLPLFDTSTDTSAQTPDVPRVEGAVTFNGQSLTLAAIDLTIQDIHGELTFADESLDASGLQANIFELPVFVSLEGASTAAGANLRARGSSDTAYQLSIGIDNTWTPSQLAASPVMSWLAPHVDGELQSDTRFVMQIADGMLDYDWEMTNNLDELAIDLPAPLQREVGNDERVRVLAQGTESAIQLQILWPHIARFESALTFGEDAFSRALLEFGPDLAHGPGMPREGMDVFITLESLQLDPWLGLMNAVASDESGGLPWALPPLQQLRADVGEVRVVNQNFTDVRLEGQATNDNWDMLVMASQGRGRVRVPLGVADDDDYLQVRIDYLNLSAPTDAASSPEGASVLPQEHRAASLETRSLGEDDLTSTNRPGVAFFEGLPPLRLICELCRYDDIEFGRVEAVLDPRIAGRQLQLLNIRRSGAELNLYGGWYATDDAGYESYLNGWIAISDVGSLIMDFGKSSVVRDSNAQIELDVRWPGSPAELAIERLSGDIDWSLGAGYLRDVSDGGARLLSLFSLESLMRKLALDFRDIFARGMFYSSFRGTLNIDNGVVYTNNTRMNGSAGDMEVTGSTDLVSEALDYQLVYVPKVTSSLPVLVAWMVNPPTGIAAFLVDRVLHDAQVISRLEYSITGTVSDPIVNEEARAQRDVELPDVELEQLMEEDHGAY